MQHLSDTNCYGRTNKFKEYKSESETYFDAFRFLQRTQVHLCEIRVANDLCVQGGVLFCMCR